MANTLKSKISNILKGKSIWIILIITGIICKLILLPVKTGDSVYFLSWIDFIKSHGYFSSLKYGFYDYAPSYIYILIFISKIGLNSLYSIKIASIIFEYLAAFYIGKIAFLKYNSKITIWIALAVIPILPTVLLNSSYLSQCDSIYSALVIGSIYFILKKQQFLSVLFLGISIAFKLQAVMVLPLFYILLLRKDIKWYYFLVVPIVFIFSFIPALIFGRTLNELLNIYISQADHFHFLTLNFPNLYIWINNDYYQSVKISGMIFTFIFTILTGYWISRKKIIFTLEIWVKLAFLSSILIPFILPGMHERYMYLGDILGVLYYLILRKKIQLPLGILLVSLYSYIRCSRYNDILPMWPAFVVYLSIIIFTTFDFINSLNNDPETIKK